MPVSKMFADFAGAVAHAAGRPLTFAASVGVIVVWALTGPLFGFSDTWQLIINTSTTIVTFLMVFLIQNTQNRDGAAIQTKLDELIRVSAAQNLYIGIEHLTEEEVEELRQKSEARAKAHPKAHAEAHAAGKRAQKKADQKAREAADRATE
jgi:low affinity Fe/Cu permease